MVITNNGNNSAVFSEHLHLGEGYSRVQNIQNSTANQNMQVPINNKSC